jgi:hypothetical protein
MAPLPLDQKALGSKWALTVKRDAHGNVERYKAWLVVQGFRQQFGFDYDETYSPVIQIDNVRLLFAIGAHFRPYRVVIWHFDFLECFPKWGSRLLHLHQATFRIQESTTPSIHPPPPQIAIWPETSVKNLVHDPLSIDLRSWFYEVSNRLMHIPFK